MNAMTKTELTPDDRLDKLEAQATDLFRQLRNVRQELVREYGIVSRLEALEKPHIDVIAGMAAKIDESAQHIGTLQQMVRLLMDKVGKLEVAAVCDPIIASAEPKRTIKGGWVNVYAGDLGFASLSEWTYETKGEADYKANRGRIACIQIPDITEGEGL